MYPGGRRRRVYPGGRKGGCTLVGGGRGVPWWEEGGRLPTIPPGCTWWVYTSLLYARVYTPGYTTVPLYTSVLHIPPLSDVGCSVMKPWAQGWE